MSLEDAQQGAVGKKRLGSLDVYLQNVQPLAQSVPMPKPVTRPVQKRSKAALVAVASKPMSIASGVAVSQTASSPVAIPARDPTAEAPVVTGLERFPRELKITYIWEFLPVPAHMTWKVVNGRYDLRLEGSFLGISRTFVSSGKVGKNGVTPERFIEYRNEATNHTTKLILIGKSSRQKLASRGVRRTRKSRMEIRIFFRPHFMWA